MNSTIWYYITLIGGGCYESMSSMGIDYQTLTAGLWLGSHGLGLPGDFEVKLAVL